MTEKRKRMDEGEFAFRDEWLPLADLRIDSSVNTKPFYPARVEAMAKDFNPVAIGIFHVSRRADGTLWLFDGQHRKALLERVGWGDQLVRCRVYSGLARADEARIFRDLNTSYKPSRMDDFLAAITEGDQEAISIDNIAKSAGLAIHRQAGEGHITAIAACQAIYRGDLKGIKRPDPTALLYAVECLRDAFGTDSSSFRGTVLQGLGFVFLRENGRTNRKRMVERLASVPGGAAGLEARARQAKDIHNRSLPMSAAGVITDLYNRGLPPEKRLGSWWSSS